MINLKNQQHQENTDNGIYFTVSYLKSPAAVVVQTCDFRFFWKKEKSLEGNEDLQKYRYSYHDGPLRLLVSNPISSTCLIFTSTAETTVAISMETVFNCIRGRRDEKGSVSGNS
jgi:hypothetical protein